MSKTPKTIDRPSLLITAVDEVPRISDAELAALRNSLGKASSNIASGDFDVLTPQSLRTEFDSIYFDGKSDADLDSELAMSCAQHS
jgi:hypothetical protein